METDKKTAFAILEFLHIIFDELKDINSGLVKIADKELKLPEPEKIIFPKSEKVIFPSVQKVEIINQKEIKIPAFPEPLNFAPLLVSILQAIREIPVPPKTVTLVDEEGRPINLSKLFPKAEEKRYVSMGKPGGQSTKHVHNETPSGLINSANTSFSLLIAPKPADSLALYLNGIRLQNGGDYTLSGTNITMINPPDTNSIFLADYNYS